MKNPDLNSEEMEWCKMTISRISNQLPKQYSIFTKARLEKQGIKVSTRYIIDCRNLMRYDTRVVKALEKLTQDLTKGKN